MCGRYRLSRRKQIIEEHFDSVSGEEDWSPRYNIAPTQPIPVIRQNPKEPVRELSLVRWGLIPSWAKDPPSPTQPGEKRVSFNWPVSKDVIAEVTFRGGEVNVSHLKTLAKYLELMQGAIEEMKNEN